MRSWIEAVAGYQRDGVAAMLVTVIAVRGSTPREAGAKMAVTATEQAGTIGGGNLEFQCARAARELLDGTEAGPLVREYPLGPALGQCCGGHASVLFEVLRPPTLHVALFGAGHVGAAVVRLLAELPCRVTWIDPRAEAFPLALPGNVRSLPAEVPATMVALLPGGALVLVMTHDHALDFDIVAAALARDDLPFVGMIGSATKRMRFLRGLRELGIGDAALARFACPIGLPGVGGKLPAEIAVSIAAQILQIGTISPSPCGRGQEAVASASLPESLPLPSPARGGGS